MTSDTNRWGHPRCHTGCDSECTSLASCSAVSCLSAASCWLVEWIWERDCASCSGNKPPRRAQAEGAEGEELGTL